jgi:colanic acid biosynthesis glycosyl transferase WcaI
MERFMYDRSSCVTVIAPSFKRNLEQKGVDGEKITVIPNFVDTDFIRPLPRNNAFSSGQDLDGRVSVGYAGNLGYVSQLETLLEAAKILEGRSRMRFLIVGEGVAKPGLEADAKRLMLTNTTFLPFQPRSSLPEMRAAMDIHVSLYRRGASSDSLPSKTYEIMASGRPMVLAADPGSDVWNLVETTGCGVCIEPGDPKALAESLLRLEADPEKRNEMGRLGRIAAEASYSRSAAVTSYERLLQALAAGDRHRRVKTPTALLESARQS